MVEAGMTQIVAQVYTHMSYAFKNSLSSATDYILDHT
jgi:hypothetical protein